MSNNLRIFNINLMLALFVVVILIVFFAFWCYNYLKPVSTEDLNMILELEVIENDSSENLFHKCDIYSSEERRDICVIRETSCREDECFFNRAMTLRNVSICAEILVEDVRFGCEKSVLSTEISENAITENNVSLCSQLGGELGDQFVLYCQDNYYFAKSINMNNLSYCSKIVEEVMRDECQN